MRSVEKIRLIGAQMTLRKLSDRQTTILAGLPHKRQRALENALMITGPAPSPLENTYV
jgi:hypothetical protein